MKKIIPFSKEISFKTRIAEITDIEVTHDLERTPFNTIDGNFLVNGTYKMHEASQVEEKFSYDLPFTIEVDEKYDLSDVKIKISDFFFEIIDEDILKVNIEVELTEVKERENIIEEQQEEEPREELVVERCYDEEESETKEEIQEEVEEAQVEEERPKDDSIEVVEPIDILDAEIPKVLEAAELTSTVVNQPTPNQKEATTASKPITDIFTSINNDEDTFKTYHVYIVRENDTLEEILSRYQVTKEQASEYNDLNDIKIGSKLILPCAQE